MTPFTELPGHLDDAVAEGIAPWTETVRKDFHVAVFEDKFPVTKGHLLFVPQYPTSGVICDAFEDALNVGMQKVATGEWESFNIGMNFGAAAGQTVAWPHIHLIPRKFGDCADPTGGVRNVIFGQGNYQKTSYKNPSTI